MKAVIIIFVHVIASSLNAQKDVKLSISSKINQTDIQQLMDFEGLNLTHFSFESEKLMNTFYRIKVKEFKDGNLVNNQQLFDGGETDYFKVDTTLATFNIITKIGDDGLKIGLRTDRFASKVLHFNLSENSARYALKDFTTQSNSLYFDSEESMYLLAIITPKMNPDGSGSYCAVAQSGINPEMLGKEFDIPHYFLVEIQWYDSLK